MAAVAQWEWMLILLLVLAVAVWELLSVRRAIRRDKARRGRTPEA